jgi:hypothetical protein
MIQMSYKLPDEKDLDAMISFGRFAGDHDRHRR